MKQTPITSLVAGGILAFAVSESNPLAATPATPASNPAKPWRLGPALGQPDWLDVSGTYRTRYETLDGQFRAGRAGGDQMLALRTTLRADFKYEAIGVTGEFSDSRQYLADTGSPLDTSMVDAVELLQAHGSVRFDGPFGAGSRSEVRFGRQTLDLGSRRLVARNSYRNTMNSFTGVHWQWQLESGPTLRFFHLLPVNRLPVDAPSLLDNEIQFNEESFDLQLWGFHSTWKGLPLGGAAEFYFLGLNEQDSVRVPSRNRELYTPGLRYHRPKGKAGWDFDFESIVQLGEARNSTAAADVRDLDHFAHFHHAEIGYTFGMEWSPRAAAFYDHASGDDDPSDGKSNRFDTLFSARRFDHGPTGIYGAFARANIQSPGMSLGVKPVAAVEAEAKYRPYWLASDKDAWTTSGLRDATGRSGSFVGHQVEASVRWDLLPGNLRLEVGGAHLFAGEFMKNAPNGGGGKGDSTYGYASIELRF